MRAQLSGPGLRARAQARSTSSLVPGPNKSFKPFHPQVRHQGRAKLGGHLSLDRREELGPERDRPRRLQPELFGVLAGEFPSLSSSLALFQVSVC